MLRSVTLVDPIECIIRCEEEIISDSAIGLVKHSLFQSSLYLFNIYLLMVFIYLFLNNIFGRSI